jgi:hypothetical protein
MYLGPSVPVIYKTQRDLYPSCRLTGRQGMPHLSVSDTAFPTIRADILHTENDTSQSEHEAKRNWILRKACQAF